MSKRKRRRYTDEERAHCVLMLEVAGYEETPTKARETVSKSQGVPESTLRSWWNRAHASGGKPERGTIPAQVYHDKKDDLRTLIKNELVAILGEMPNARPDANFRDLGWVGGVLFDKLQLLDDKPTAIIKLREAYEKGQVTREEIMTRYPSLASQFFATVDD